MFAVPKEKEATAGSSSGNPSSNPASSSAVPASDEKIRFFDAKRANNIGIMMSQFRGVTGLQRGEKIIYFIFF